MLKNLRGVCNKSARLMSRTTKMASNGVKCHGKAVDLLKNAFSVAVRSVTPSTLLRNKVRLIDGHLAVAGRNFPLSKPCYIVGFGKAVLGMAQELESVLGDSLERALITVPKGIFLNYPEIRGNLLKTICIEGAKDNIPDEDAVRGAIQIRDLVDGLEENDILIVLISGGGLAEIAYPCTVVSLILSDVVGDPLDIIASGPTTLYSDDPSRAIRILNKYDLYKSLPISIKSVLESSPATSHTNQNITDNGQYKHVHNIIIGTNKIATEAAKDYVNENNFQCAIISHQVQQDVEELSKFYAKLAKSLIEGSVDDVEALLGTVPFKLEKTGVDDLVHFDFSKKMMLIFAGEPTVVVKGKGIGGRNQQLALEFSLELNQFHCRKNIWFLSGGTDGIDGPTDAAGAIGFAGLAQQSLEHGIDAEQYLVNNDSYRFFSQYAEGLYLLKTGHTGTNVMDVHLLLIDPEN
ncbi:glycerate kinase isoform X2 [Rhynchophorus ferrugineus]|uniref:glycerate kinase isoform X2 n=1 Tax=Rhynchophorus ferrugineus TaxID=354439 RepID=UPI003FCCB0D7